MANSSCDVELPQPDANPFSTLGLIPSGQGDEDGLRLERRLGTEAVMTSIGEILFGQGG